MAIVDEISVKDSAGAARDVPTLKKMYNTHDAAVTDNSVRASARARTSALASVANDDVADNVASKDGILVVRQNAVPELLWSYAGTGIASSTTAVDLKTAAGSGLSNVLTGLQVSWDTLGGDTLLLIQSATTPTVLFRILLKSGSTGNLSFPGLMLRSLANEALQVKLGSSVSGSIYVNAQGHVERT